MEAEYFGTLELPKEVFFAKQILETMGVILEFPIIVEVDNTEAIYIANYYTAGQGTKHIDTRAHFVCEFLDDGVLKVVFVCSEDNGADIYTKKRSSCLRITRANTRKTSQNVWRIKYTMRNREDIRVTM
jgi:hypothetical protein